MKPFLQRVIVMLIVTLAVNPSACPQDAQALHDYLAGQRFLVTYRQGGPVYGTYFFLRVHLCPSGNYITFGQSRKQSVLDTHAEQVHNWRDQGRWDAGVYGGQMGIQYISSSGQTAFYPISVGANGEIRAGNGMSVVREGPAQCQ